MTETTATPGTRRASVVLASGTIVSRVLGFISAAVLTWVIGLNNPGANAFAIANTLPNNILPLIAGGLLSAVLVPQIVRAALDPDGGDRFVSRLLTLGITAFVVVTAVAVALAPVLIAIYTAGGSHAALQGGGVTLALVMSYWCLPQLFFYALFALLGEVLNARAVFGPITWVPAVNNIIVIASLVAFAAVFGVDPAHRDPSSWGTGEIALLAGGATLGVAAQAIGLVFFWRRTGLRFRPDFHWRGVGLGSTGRAGAWTFGMIVVTLIAGIVQTNVALTAGADDASVAVLKTAWLIYILPHSIIAMSIATASYTRIAGHARDGDIGGVRSDLSSALRSIALLVAGAGVALAAAALPFSAFFANTSRELDSTALVLLAYLPGLVPYGVLFLLQRTFYALGDTRTPFFIQLVQAVLFIAGAFLMLLVPPQYVAAGIAAVTTVAGTAQTLVSAIILRRRMGRIDGTRLLRRLGAYALATIPAAAAGLAVLAVLGGLGSVFGTPDGFALSGKFAALLSVALVGGVTAIVFIGVLALARVPEVYELLVPVKRLLRRS